MKRKKCRLCDEWFEPTDPAQHVCGECWDEDIVIARELSDPCAQGQD